MFDVRLAESVCIAAALDGDEAVVECQPGTAGEGGGERLDEVEAAAGAEGADGLLTMGGHGG
jgi:hypothetical protein